jgi:tetratricopeptide (TPR) repeat protein
MARRSRRIGVVLQLIRTAFVALLFFMSAAAVRAQSQPTSAPELTPAQWREDLHFMADEMKARHSNLYHQVSKARFDSAVADLDARIPQLQRNQIIVGMMRIAAMVGDGHTRIEPRKDKAFGFRSLPIKLYWFDDGIYVRASTPTYRDLLGARVESVGGVPVAEAIRRTSELVSKETPSGPRLFVPLYLAMPDVLQALGLSDSRQSVTFSLARGSRHWSVRVPVGDVSPPWPSDTDISLMTPDGWLDAHPGPPPLWLQAPLDFHRLIALPEHKALYVQLNMVADTDHESLKAFGDRVLQSVRDIDPAVVALDLRLDQGGNGDLANPFVADLIRAQDDDTRIVVLVARGTFSASQFILNDLDRLSDAAFIGEPASSRPSGYGDSFKAIMPNSGIAVRTSIRYWQSGQDMRTYTPIDIAAPLAFSDYVAGRDPALEAALNDRPEAGLDDQLIAVGRANGPDAALKLAQDYVANPVHRCSDIEASLVEAEQGLWRKDQGAAALLVARWGAKRFPRNGDLATVLAYVAHSQGKHDEALAAVEAALAIDPNNRPAQSLKESIENKTKGAAN